MFELWKSEKNILFKNTQKVVHKMTMEGPGIKWRGLRLEGKRGMMDPIIQRAAAAAEAGHERKELCVQGLPSAKNCLSLLLIKLKKDRTASPLYALSNIIEIKSWKSWLFLWFL